MLRKFRKKEMALYMYFFASKRTLRSKKVSAHMTFPLGASALQALRLCL
jgi:hypothetical protein